MNFFLVAIYTTAERELARAPDEERDARRTRLKSLWGAMQPGERALAQRAIYTLVTR